MFALSLSSFAQRWVELSGQTQSQVVTALTDCLHNVSVVDCKFVQTKSSPYLKQAVKSEGVMRLKKPDYFRWEYTAPYKLVIEMIRDSICVLKDGKLQRQNYGQQRMVGDIMKMVMEFSTNNVLLDKRLYDVVICENRTQYKVVLTPKNKRFCKLFSCISLFFDKKSNHIDSFILTEKKQSETTILFSEVKVQ